MSLAWQKEFLKLNQQKGEKLLVNGTDASSTAFALWQQYQAVCQSSCMLVIAADVKRAQDLFDDLCFFAGSNRLLFFPSRPLHFGDALLIHESESNRRVETLCSLVNGFEGIVVSTYEAISQKTLPADELKKYLYQFSLDDELDVDTLAKTYLKLVLAASQQYTIMANLLFAAALWIFFHQAPNTRYALSSWATT